MSLKVCATCNEEFSSSETFCSKDGTRLEEVKRAGGSLTGGVLSDTVKLERLEFADFMGERYSGRTVEKKRAVYVTVFSRDFAPSQDAQRLVERARARVGNPLPPQLSALLQANFEHTPAFVMETQPRGPSIRSLLQGGKKLDWETAVKVGANVARIIDWLATQGVGHHGLHPGSIFITDLGRGEVQLGEWYTEDAQWVENPLQMLESGNKSFVGYVAYMAPELVEDSSAADLRSAVYALGVLIYEMIVGKPPFSDPDPAEVLRRHVCESPVGISIARGGGKVHSDLDQIVEMMLAKDPEHRFQAPAAIIAALSNLVDLPPDEVAPLIERADRQEDDDVFQTIEMSSFDRSKVPELEDVLAAASRSAEGAVETVAIRKVETKQNAVALAAKAEARKAGPRSGRVPSEDSSKTLMMGKIGPALEAEAQRQLDAEPKTKATKPVEEKSAREIEVDPSLAADVESGVEDSATADSATADSTTADSATADSATDVSDVSATDVSDIKATEDRSQPEVEHAPEEESEVVPDAVDAEVPADRSNPTMELHREEWFSGDADEDQWENSLVAAEHSRSEDMNKKIGIGVGVGLVVMFICSLIYFEFVHEPDVEEPKATPTVAVKVEYDPAPTVEKLEMAISSKRLVAPMGNSALHYLKELSLRASDKPVYEESRVKFVDAARSAAQEADKSGDLMAARALAGYASQFAPEDKELKEFADALQARYIGATEAIVDMGTDAEVDLAQEEADLGVVEEPEPEVVAVEPDLKPEDPKPEDPKPDATPDKGKKHAAERDPEAAQKLIAEATSAYGAGRSKKAEAAYLEALKFDESNSKIHAGLGQIYFDQANYRTAVKYQGKAVKLAPKNSNYRLNLGQSYYRLGRYIEALKVWQGVLKNDPNNKKAKQYIKLAERKLD